MGLFKRGSSSTSAPPAYTASAKDGLLTALTSGTVLEQIGSSSSSSSSTLASLSLHMTDRIRMLRFPASTIEAVRKVIVANWPRGIQAVRLYAGSHEFKLRGKPWSVKPVPVNQGPDIDDPTDEAMAAVRLMKGVLEELYNEGWVLHTSTNCLKKEYSKDTLVFRFQDLPPARCEWMSVAFVGGNCLRFIDAPQELVTSLLENLKLEVRNHGWPSPVGIYTVKMVGCPWIPNGEQTMKTRLTLLKLIEGLEMHGFTMYTSINQFSNLPGGKEADVWHCFRKLGDSRT